MKKIISLFQRNYEGDRQVRNELVPGAEWVVAGEGVATRKWDGTSVLLKDGKLFKRFDAKQGKAPPAGFIAAQDPDPITGHHPGWIEVGDGPEEKWHREAMEESKGIALKWGDPLEEHFPDGTYELIGPKIQGNPENSSLHRLVAHGGKILDDCPRDFDGIREYLATHDVEGIVWWRDQSDPDCDKVKIKAKDFGIKRGARREAVASC